MAESYKVLGQVAPAAASAVPLYTVPSATEAVISTISVCNLAPTEGTFRIDIRPDDEPLSDKNYLVYDAQVSGKDTLFLTVGATMNSSDVLGVYASSASFSFNAFGSEIS